MSSQSLVDIQDIGTDVGRGVKGLLTGGLSETPIGRAVGAQVGGALGLNETAGQRALKAQKKLEDERRAQLAAEAAERQAAKTRASTAGQRAGAGARSAFLGPLGFGSAATEPVGGTLFGN